ncbi:MAG: hypothetical protein M3442_19945 [Chloroflexota bacterium]|nr:hypothetical protein [Chloroflexota bacterium]
MNPIRAITILEAPLPPNRGTRLALPSHTSDGSRQIGGPDAAAKWSECFPDVSAGPIHSPWNVDELLG